MSKLIEKLARKIEQEVGLKMDPDTFISLRPKPSYKCAGAWSWEMKTVGDPSISRILKVGSCWTATECAKKKVKLYAVNPGWGYCSNEVEIVPEDEDI